MYWIVRRDDAEYAPYYLGRVKSVHSFTTKKELAKPFYIWLEARIMVNILNALYTHKKFTYEEVR